MLKTRSKLLKEVYPVLLFLSLLLTWELTSLGSSSPSPPELQTSVEQSSGIHALPPAASRAPASLGEAR